MPAIFPAAVPEIPVSSISKAIEYYEKNLGFTLDWGGEEGGIAGISQGDCRMFLTSPEFRASYGNAGRVMVWLNVSSKAEVDELCARWKTSQGTIVSEPEDKPWNLREFTMTDPDGNLFRVFYDFSSDVGRR